MAVAAMAELRLRKPLATAPATTKNSSRATIRAIAGPLESTFPTDAKVEWAITVLPERERARMGGDLLQAATRACRTTQLSDLGRSVMSWVSKAEVIQRGGSVDDVEQRFRRLASIWRVQRPLRRTAVESAMHPAYQEIVGLGRDGLPFILKELEREVDHWFWALRAITGADPVDPVERGDLDKMAQAWLRWARDQGIRW